MVVIIDLHYKQAAFITTLTLRRVLKGPCLEPQECHLEELAPLGLPSPLWTHCLTLHLFPPSAHCLNPDNKTEEKYDSNTDRQVLQSLHLKNISIFYGL